MLASHLPCGATLLRHPVAELGGICIGQLRLRLWRANVESINSVERLIGITDALVRAKATIPKTPEPFPDEPEVTGYAEVRNSN